MNINWDNHAQNINDDWNDPTPDWIDPTPDCIDPTPDEKIKNYLGDLSILNLQAIKDFESVHPNASTETWITFFNKICEIVDLPEDASDYFFKTYEPYCNHEKIMQLTVSNELIERLKIAMTKITKKKKTNEKKNYFDFEKKTIIRNGHAVSREYFETQFYKRQETDGLGYTRWSLGVVLSGALEIWRNKPNSFNEAIKLFNIASNHLNQNLLQHNAPKSLISMTRDELAIYTILPATINHSKSKQPNGHHLSLFYDVTSFAEFDINDYEDLEWNKIQIIKEYLQQNGNSFETMKMHIDTRPLYNWMCDRIRNDRETSLLFHGKCRVPIRKLSVFVEELYSLLQIKRELSLETMETLKQPTIIVGSTMTAKSPFIQKVARQLDKPIIRCPLFRYTIDKNGNVKNKQCDCSINLTVCNNTIHLKNLLEKIKTIEHTLTPNIDSCINLINAIISLPYGRRRKFPVCPICATTNFATEDILNNYNSGTNISDPTVHPTRVDCTLCGYIFCSDCFRDHFTTTEPMICRGVYPLDVTTDISCPNCNIIINKDPDTSPIISCTNCTKKFCAICMCFHSENPVGMFTRLDDHEKRHICPTVLVYTHGRYNAEDIVLLSSIERLPDMWYMREDGYIEYNIYKRHPHWRLKDNNNILRKFLTENDEHMSREY